MKVEEQILLDENERKPNLYTANAVMYSFVAILFVEILNEVGIFHVYPARMRFCCLLGLLCSGGVQLIRHNDKRMTAQSTKYHVLLLILLETLIVMVLISQWTELVLALPIMLAMQYHSRELTRFTMVGTILIALVSAPLSTLLQLPQFGFYEFQLRSIGYTIETALDPSYDRWFYAKEVFKYVSIPRCVLVSSYWPLANYITTLVSGNVQSRANATYYSTTDIMTGLRNRFSFEEKTGEYRAARPEGLVCVYADADGLHELNNEKGHEAGDALLRVCARAMAGEFGEQTYRIGGDEFLCYVETGEKDAVAAGVERVRQAVTSKGYHLSIGMSCLEEGKTVDDLVREAESAMYAAKHAYYVRTGKDRRKNRQQDHTTEKG